MSDDNKRQLDAAMATYNGIERAEFMLDTANRWLHSDGPTYLLGDTRAKALFEDSRGRHWADGALVAESIGHSAGDPMLTDSLHQDLCHPDIEVRDLWVVTDSRGRWNALMAPIEVIAREFDRPPPVLLPGQNWARTWWTQPTRSDEQELAWIAAGGPAYDHEDMQ